MHFYLHHSQHGVDAGRNWRTLLRAGRKRNVRNFGRWLRSKPRRLVPGLSGSEWRDSAGRTHCTEEPLLSTLDPSVRCGDAWATIADPVAGHLYHIDTIHQVAHRIAGGSSQAPIRAVDLNPSATRPAAAKGEANSTTESLGTQTISGVLAVGTRTTTTGA